ncbi:Predicted DNA-binding transcriptional regulator YafY, contains an HTH and WYL domains [Pseudidiomarina planktonica]|uniref:Predicted DNA-binding transcriptional regulator YafY, contains an HTH and WYL domains n=1 Tax=Pseudidiomarina planktonica TaxID=1323738 RepID=A0A1Y6ECE0_9GAMM|nr:YafY family protein [Pseudidiomarina planktonica]RUO66360.1 YafY family transcriptional regulator [Pseudidiomarina planktonica]SMQ58570.1 Predicted DNA-binding transcriptional regulator YafY, contains an HTH and WYL domains [Pseudidiomarina planktonica]
MTGPTTRVLALLELLQSHKRLNGSELAEMLGVDKRTVRRYVRALEDLGIPVTTEQGPHGGYMLVAGFKLPPMMFTHEETLALSLGLLAAKTLQLTDASPALTSVQAKLERVMPEHIQARARSITQHTNLLLPDGGLPQEQALLMPLMEAIESQRRVQIIYVGKEKAGLERELDPYGMFYRLGHWYIGGFCHLRQALRIFRLDRLAEVTLLKDKFERPTNYNAAEQFNENLCNMPGNLAVRVLLHTDLDTATRELGSSASILKPEGDALYIETMVDSTHWFAWWLARLPFDFTIIGPDSLKQALRERAEKLMSYC